MIERIISKMQRVAVLCLLLGALAAAAAGQERGNCEKYCDVSVNGTAPPAEWCYCFAGEVARNGKTKLKRLREITKEKSGKTRQTSDDKQEVTACPTASIAVPTPCRNHPDGRNDREQPCLQRRHDRLFFFFLSWRLIGGGCCSRLREVEVVVAD